MKLATIGYENDTQADVIARLKDAGVAVVVDVRAVASSRKAGFSKTLLAASLAEAGIDYVHLQKLGTPKAGRDAARAGRIEEMKTIFNGHMAEPVALVELARAGEIATHRKAALLCYEADACGCHRLILAERLSKALGLEIENL
ncbi:hypothetical protein BH11PSE2_BH11PSE2_00580 [soil metagenome]